MIKAVFFDLDNTLYQYDPCQKAALVTLDDYAREHFHMEPEEFHEMYSYCMKTLTGRIGPNNASIHNLLIRLQNIMERIHQPYYPHVPDMLRTFWKTFRDHMEVEPDAEKTLQELKKRGIFVGIGTNQTADVQYMKLDQLGLLPYIDMVITSEEALAEKPSPRFFQCCLEKASRVAGAEASGCLFVGDTFAHDIIGSARAGMHPVWYRPFGGTELPEGCSEPADLKIITSLTEVLALTENI